MTPALRSRFGLAIVVSAVALAAIVTRAHAACDYSGSFTAGTTYSVSTTPYYIHYENPVHQRLHWGAFAITPPNSQDWDVRLYSSTAADPICVSGLLASSTAGNTATDFVLGDWRNAASGTYYPSFTRYSGTGTALASWAPTETNLDVNAPALTASMANTPLRVYSVNLVAGTAYTIRFTRTSGTADIKLMMFVNPGTGAYFTGRPSAIYTATATGTYTPTTSGLYALVLVNDSYGAAASVEFGVGDCSAITALTASTVTAATSDYAYWSFAQATNYWTAVAVRGPNAPQLTVYGDQTAGSGWPACLGSAKAGSYAGSGVNLIVGDFNHNAQGTYNAQASSSTGASVEWDTGPDAMMPGAVAQAYATGPTNILRCWDTYLSAGGTYDLYFRATNPNVKLLLFRNPASGEYWAPRTSAVLELSGCGSFTAPATDYYGLVVVNDTGDTASYVLGVGAPACACPTPLVDQVTVTPATANGQYTLTPASGFWSAVGTRGISSSHDWDLAMYGSPTGSASPTCFGSLLASSGTSAGMVDFTIGDFNYGHTPPGTYYAHARGVAGVGGTGVVEWDATHGALGPNASYVGGTLATTDVLAVWDATMAAGTTYTFQFTTTAPGAKLLVFESPASGTYLVGRGAAALTVTASGATYTPTVSGWHALVLVNDLGTSGAYRFRYGACTQPDTLLADVPKLALDGQASYVVRDFQNEWGAVGVRSQSVDWDLYEGTGASGVFPVCVTGVQSYSDASWPNYVDLVVMDRSLVYPTRYASVTQFTPNASSTPPVEFSSIGQTLVVNDDTQCAGTFDTGNVLDCYSTYLKAGESYTVTLTHSGTATLHALLFAASPSVDTALTRTAAVLDVGGGLSATYVATYTGVHAVVVVNDDGAADSYGLSVKSCPTGLVVLTPNNLVDAFPDLFASITPTAGYWTAVGCFRWVLSGSYPVVEVYSQPSGGPLGICFSDLLASSQGIESTSYIVGDFNHTPFGTYYVREHTPDRGHAGWPTVSEAEWDAGMDVVLTNGSVVAGSFTKWNSVRAYDVYLQAGVTYAFELLLGGGATDPAVNLSLYRNPGNGTYWAPRSAAVVVVTQGSQSYTAPTADWYGLVVSHEQYPSQDFKFRVYPVGVGVETPTLPTETALRSVGPNPARGGTSVDFTLRERGAVRVSLLDVAGRIVATLVDEVRDAGAFHEAWRGGGTDGMPAAPGVYMVRMEVNGRLIGQRKVALIH